MAVAAALLPFPAPPASAEPDEGQAEPLVVEQITPEAIDEDSTLKVSGEVTNTTSESISDVTVRMRYSRHPFTSRDELDEFASGDGWQPSASGPDDRITAELPPGTRQSYTLSVPAEDLGLESYGVYPLVVEAVDADGAVVGAQYTFLPYTGNGKDVPSVDIAWVWPLMESPQRADDGTFLGGGLEDAVSEEGRLARLLAAGAGAEVSFEPGEEDLVELLGLDEDPEATGEEESAAAEESASPLPSDGPSEAPSEDGGDEEGEETGEPSDEAEKKDSEASGGEGVPVTWAVDPGTLDDILRMASEEYEVVDDALAVPAESEPSREEREASVAAQVWLREARRVLAGDTVVAAPYANADLAALLRNDMGGDAEAAVRIGREAVLRALELEADESYALPPGGLMDQNVHGLLSESGATRFLLSEGSLPAVSWLSTTPTAQAPLPSADGESEALALVADAGISGVLSAPTRGAGQTELALQRFAAETAMIAGENAGDDRVVVALPDSGWDPSPEFASGVLESSEELPWLSATSLDDVELPAEEDRENTRQRLTYPDGARGEELSSTYLALVEDVGRDVRLFNSILVDDDDPFRRALLRLETAYWREEEVLAGAARSLVSDEVEARLSDVRVIPADEITLVSREGTTGILVANDLEDEAVFVHLSVFSENSGRLSIGDYNVTFEIEPGAKTTVYVPLSARINGRTVVHASLHNADGEPINAQTVQIPVNATGLGTQALLISGVGALILIAALAPRALRKWVRRKRGEAILEAEAAGPSEAAEDTGPAEDAGASEAAGNTEAAETAGAAEDTAEDDGDVPATTAEPEPKGTGK